MITLEEKERLDELRAKGATRTKEEKAEYDSLSAKAQASAATETDDEDTVILDKSQLSSILAEMAKIKKELAARDRKDLDYAGTDSWTEEEVDSPNRTARLRLITIEDKPEVLIDWKFIKEVRSSMGLELLYEFTLRDKKGKQRVIQMNYDELLKHENFIRVRIVEIDKRIKARGYGQVKQKEVKDYRMEETGHYVPLKVYMDSGVATVEHEEYGTFMLPVERLNT
jgi:hypothetical protein